MFGKKFFGTVALGSATVGLVGGTGSIFACEPYCEYFAPCRISYSRKAEILKMRGTELLQEIVNAYHFSKSETEQFMKDLCDGSRKESYLGWACVYYTFNDHGCVQVEFRDQIVGAVCFNLELNAEMVNSITKNADISKILFKQ